MSLEAGVRETYITPKPFTQQIFLPNPTQDSLLNTSEALRFAKKELHYATVGDPGYDQAIINQILAVEEAIDAYLAQVLNTRRIARKDLLAEAVVKLKEQLPSLKATGDQLKGLAANTGKPEWVNVYLNMALASVAEAEARVNGLP
ncbi:hypothetical protein SAMN04489760_12538 [Syntrophus gentianae]|uniref:Uncharacterized protein n=1 Tax=Syntrophus gentianae TaxID=43775 RepID=A0A1H7ZP15_9BACT|nr:hypothetical protein [Syntrophus gentianae]SEM60046.1 hypothetical protein SAMN04489760_12538 [Syntrophus gentianae]